MTQIFAPDGATVAATLVRIEPAVVTQVRTAEKDGYSALQIGTDVVTDKRAARVIAKPQRGHLKTAGAHARRTYEVRVDAKELEENKDAWRVGAELDWKVFAPGDLVQVRGTSKGRGFAGVVKRHHFRGGPASHGHKDNLRRPGTIGSGHPQHVVKGTRMAGHMGDEQVAVTNLEVLSVDPEQRLVVLRGSVPGALHGWLSLSPTGSKAKNPIHARAELGAKTENKADKKESK